MISFKNLCNACNPIRVDLKFIGDHAEDVIRACDSPYLLNTQLIDSIFNTQSLSIVNNNQLHLVELQYDNNHILT